MSESNSIPVVEIEGLTQCEEPAALPYCDWSCKLVA